MAKPWRAWNSTLRAGDGLRARGFRERYPEEEDGPRYGYVYEAVRRLPCIYLLLGRAHRCQASVVGGHTAHHLGREDLDGLCPCCGLVHSWLEGSPGRTQADVEAELGVQIAAVGRLCVSWALWRLGRCERMAPAPTGLEALRERLQRQPMDWIPPGELAY